MIPAALSTAPGPTSRMSSSSPISIVVVAVVPRTVSLFLPLPRSIFNISILLSKRSIYTPAPAAIPKPDSMVNVTLIPSSQVFAREPSSLSVSQVSFT